MLQRGRMKDEIRLELLHHLMDALAIADIGNSSIDFGAAFMRAKRFGDRIERRF